MVTVLFVTWRTQPRFLQRIVLVVLPFIVGMLFVADFSQPRIHNELIPMLLAPALVGIHSLTGRGWLNRIRNQKAWN
jgi:hypothetical protein